MKNIVRKSILLVVGGMLGACRFACVAHFFSVDWLSFCTHPA